MIRYFLFSVFLINTCLPTSRCYAQFDTLNKKYYKNISLSFEKGPFLKSGFPSGDSLLLDSKYSGLELRLGWRKKTPNLYSYLYRHPTNGITLYMASYGNPNIGEVIALSYFFNIPFSYQSRKISFSYSAAFGVSYNNEIYNKSKNAQDIFISSAFNCSAYLGIHMCYNISNHWKVTTALGFRHFSNGSSNLPNIGINVIPIIIGLQYAFKDEKFNSSRPNLTPYQSHNIFNLFMAIGTKAYTYEGHNYFKSTTGFYYLRQLSYKYRLGIGLDIFYSSGVNDRNPNLQTSFSNSFSFGIAPTFEWILSKKLYAPMAIGFYMHRNEINDEVTLYYLRGGFRCHFTPHLFAGVTIKAHSYYSDYFEWTIGYTFHKDPNRYRLD